MANKTSIKISSEIKARKTSAPLGMSKYARKKKYCDRHGVYGFQVPSPKPWI